MSLEGAVPASSRGLCWNTGNGPTFAPLDVGHPVYLAVVEPETAFWALVRKDELGSAVAEGGLLERYRARREAMAGEMHALRFGSRPAAVYFNPTERCNLDCSYCYLPADARRKGVEMSPARLLQALGTLREHFAQTLPPGTRPEIVFHGAEPLISREAIFEAIDAFRGDFVFAVQTNGTLLDEAAAEFLTSRGISIGLSLDGDVADVADRTRKDWAGRGISAKVRRALELLRGYPAHSVICTMTTENVRSLPRIVERFHALEIPVCMLNPVRCTQPGGRDLKPADHDLAPRFLEALDRSFELYQETGRKLVVANFANTLLAIVAPTARRLMCDISPCGAGRCFFAVSAAGDVYPCSEFLGLPEFRGGNLFAGGVAAALGSPAFARVTSRTVDRIESCSRCSIRNYCGAPCPAEAHAAAGSLERPGAFCELYEEQVRYAFRRIAEGNEGAFLWDGWDDGLATTLTLA